VTAGASGPGAAAGGSSDPSSPVVGIGDEEFQLLVGSVRDYAIFLLDPSGRILSWNPGAQHIKGYSRDEVVGKPISIFYTPEDLAADKPRKLLETAISAGRVEDEGWRVRKDGTRLWASVTITALRDAAGGLRGFGKVTRDLTTRREMEERLRRSEESLSATLYSIGDAVLATDEHARILRLNPVAERLTGWSESEAIGQPIDEVFNIVNEHTRARALNPVERVLREGVVVGLANHTSLIARDGTERPIEDSGAPIRDLHGATRGAVLVFRDVSEERKAQEARRQSEERLRLMVASVRDYAIFMLDVDGRITSWNAGAERIHGWSAEEVIGVDFSRLFLPEDAAAGQPRRELETAARLGRFEYEGWRARKDGVRFWANATLSAVRDERGGLVGFAKITRDLTERRKAEEQRLHLAQAEEAIRLRDEFLSIASHELKTPLTALKLQLYSVQQKATGVDEALASRTERAVRASDRLADLIETLLDVSRIATGRLSLHLEPCDLVAIAREVVDRHREAATAAGSVVSIEADGPVTGSWDRLRVEQILTNLLSNAMKYAPRTAIVVRVAREADAAVLDVRDAGPGIPEADLARIFERFERASPQSYGGLGLGLYIARQIAEAHGGTLTAASAPGNGAVFTVRLPLAASPPG
jgi:PAS domain S-box-containing protein